MFDRPTTQDVESLSGSSPGPDEHQFHDDEHRLGDCESRVSTDSDLDLESEDDDDDYRSTFSGLLMRKLISIEQAQQQHVLEEKELRASPRPLFTALADDSYWAKMRRVSQWRQSTQQSETSSDYSPAPSISRKRRLSDASESQPSSSKRPRLASLSPAPPGSPFFPRARAYPLDSADNTSDPGAYPRTYVRLRAQLNVHPYIEIDAPLVCTACDTTFASRQRLRRHGRGAWTPDACRAAVTYGLE